MHVYRVTKTRRRKLGLREWDEKRFIPLATRQRVACILNYQAQLPDEERWTLKIERAEISDDWQPVEFSIPEYHSFVNHNTPPSQLPRVYLEKLWMSQLTAMRLIRLPR